MPSRTTSITLAALLLLPSCSNRSSPIISYEDALPIDGDWSITQFPNKVEQDEIIRFVESIRGIDHRVQEIAVKSRSEVRVDTGRLSPLDWEKDRYGDTVRLQRVDGRWTVSERSTWSQSAEKDPIYVWDGTSELAMVADVTDSVTHKPIFGATVEAVRVGGRNTEPLTEDYPTAMPPPQKTGRGGRARLVGYFRAAGDAGGFCVFVGDSLLRVDAPGYRPKEARLSPNVRLDFPRKTKHCEVTLPVALTRE
jgi:hypothetical protein